MDRLETNGAALLEQDLIERLKKKQKWAFNQLVCQYQDQLLRLAFGITLDREESLEIVQDVFISVFKHIGTFRQESSLATWLRKITIHLCLNWKRRWKRRFKWDHLSTDETHGRDQAESNLCNDNNPEILFLEKQLEKGMVSAIQKLPEKVRLVFILNAIEGLSYEEIATTLNIKKGTVSSRLYLARKIIMDTLELGEGERNSHGKKM